MSEAKFTPGPWTWYGSTRSPGRVYLATYHSGRCTVMGFRRSGLQGAEPEFQVNSRMVPASELVRYDVDPSVRGKTAAKSAPSVYRHDFSAIDHPDARLISAAPELYEALEHALVTIKALHGPVAWEIYERSSPEMNRYRAALAKARGEQ